MPRHIKRTIPGDPGTMKSDQGPRIDQMIRVNHAGEYGAKRIYQGQLAVLSDDPELKETLTHMAEQEDQHLKFFENEIVSRQTRPTLLQPFWHIAGYGLGYITAKMGKEAAMACTVAVETVISEHYEEQLNELGDKEPKLKASIQKFKEEEEEHHDIGLQNGAELAKGYPVLSNTIKAGCRTAIWLAKRI